MSSNELVRREPAEESAYGLIHAEEVFTPARREAIAQFLEIPAEHPAMVPYLAVCARYGLDPIMGQVWLIPQKIKAKDGKPAREILRPAAGRDGYLAVARRQPDYGGIIGDVVCARDRFKVSKRIDAMTGEESFVVEHDYPELQDVIAAERGHPDAEARKFDPAVYRGPIIGAYAICYPKGRKPVYYFASIREHGKTWQSQDGQRSGWQGAWEYTSTMILKAAQSYVLRIAYGITGMVPVDEMAENPPVTEEAPRWDPASVLPESFDDAQREIFTQTVERSWEVDPNLWNRSKLEMYAGGLSAPEQFAELLNRIEEETEAELEVRAREGAGVEVIQEAEVVPEPEGVPEREALLHQLADVEAALEDNPNNEALLAEKAQLEEELR